MKKHIFTVLTLTLALLLLASCGSSGSGSAYTTPSRWTKNGTTAASGTPSTGDPAGSGAPGTTPSTPGSTPSASGSGKILTMMANELLTNPNGFAVNIAATDDKGKEIDPSRISVTFVVTDANGNELYNGAGVITPSANGGYPRASFDYSQLKGATSNKGTAKYTVKAGNAVENFETELKKLPIKPSSVIILPTFPAVVNHCGKDTQTGQPFPYAKLTVSGCTFDDSKTITDGDKVTLTFSVTREKLHENCPTKCGFYLVVTQNGTSKKNLVLTSYGTDGKPTAPVEYQLRVNLADGPITLSVEDYQ